MAEVEGVLCVLFVRLVVVAVYNVWVFFSFLFSGGGGVISGGERGCVGVTSPFKTVLSTDQAALDEHNL